MAGSDDKELTHAHGRARAVVQGLITFTLLLVVLAFAGVSFNLPQSLRDPKLYFALWIVILFFGLGSVVLRRVRMNAARLQDIAGLYGQTALVASLVKTTMFVAALGGAIAVLGFVAYLLSGYPLDMLKAGVVAIAVLLYAYPRRAAWSRVLEASQQPDGIPGASPTKGTSA